MKPSDARKAARLVMLGTQASLHPSKSIEYRRLLADFLQDLAFRELATEIAGGLGLGILHASAEGLVVAPLDAESPFAMKLGQFKSRLPGRWQQEASQGVVILLNVGIVSAFYPTPAHIEDPERGSNTVNIPEVIQSVRAACAALAQAQAEQREGTEAFPADLTPAFQRLLNLPDSNPEAKRRSGNNLAGLIESLLEMYTSERLVAKLDEHDETPSYFATERLRQMLRRRSGTLLECCHDLIAEAHAPAERTPEGA